MEMINETMVELCQQIMETKQYQGKQIAKLISHIETLTNILASNGTIEPPQEEYKKGKT